MHYRALFGRASCDLIQSLITLTTISVTLNRTLLGLSEVLPGTYEMEGTAHVQTARRFAKIAPEVTFSFFFGGAVAGKAQQIIYTTDGCTLAEPNRKHLYDLYLLL